MKKKLRYAVSYLMLIGALASAKTPQKERKQHLKKIMMHIKALTTKADHLIQQRDRLTAYLRLVRQKYREES